MFRNIQKSQGFGWAVRAMAFVMLGTFAIALAILARHKPATPPKKRKFSTLFDFKAMKEPAFLCFCVGLFCIFLGFYIPLFYM